MKRLITCVGIMIAAVCFALYAFNTCDTAAESVKSDIGKMMNAIEAGDNITAQQYADNAAQRWQQLSFGTVFVEDTECDNEITMTLANIQSMCRSNDEDIPVECARLYRLLDTFINRQRVTIGNVF